MEESTVVRKRGREDSESVLSGDSDSPEVKRLREKLLEGLDDEGEFFEASQDLDSFMKSFQEEITASPATAAGVGAVDLDSDCGETRPDLGYLLEASDAELGIPPASLGLGSEPRAELSRVESESSEFGGGFWEIPGYDSFGFGFGEVETNYGDGGGEYVALDGLFDYSDLAFGSGGFAYRPESLPAQ